jgi:hypothetical protein
VNLLDLKPPRAEARGNLYKILYEDTEAIPKVVTESIIQFALGEELSNEN